jgi:glyoxylase-like metal-dependent hydrolase (beta-lactamase superfamily II)
MIDGGAPNKAESFLKYAKRFAIDPKEIQLIILTHGHWDHIASVKRIQEITGAKIVMHHREKEWLEKPLKPSPPGVTVCGRILSTLLRPLTRFVDVPKAQVDIVVPDDGLSLAEYGIRGEVIYTPGHSPGSISVLLETGDVFVGDLAMNRFPLRLKPGLPIFADDIDRVKQSWKVLLDGGARIVYPGHGKPFSADRIAAACR